MINGIPRDPDADNLQSKTPCQRRSESQRNVPRSRRTSIYTHYPKSPDRRATQDTEKLNRPSSPPTKVSSSALPRSDKLDPSSIPSGSESRPRQFRVVHWPEPGSRSSNLPVSESRRVSSILTVPEYPPRPPTQHPSPEDPPHSKSCCGANGGCVVQRSKQQHC